jgi:hypothetical protein
MSRLLGSVGRIPAVVVAGNSDISECGKQDPHTGERGRQAASAAERAAAEMA